MPKRKSDPRADNPSPTDGDVPRESFEVLLARVERAAEGLESGELGLDEALRRYAEGVSELRKASAVLREAEAKVKVLEEADEGLRLEDLDADDEDASENGEDDSEDDDDGMFL